MARRYFTKSLDASKVQAHISPGDVSTDIKLGEYVSHECSVIFFDLNNFTNISWTLTTKQVMSIIQPFFTKASEEITKHGGMVDKFPGDGVVGFFPRLYANENNTISDSALDCATKVMYWFYNTHRPSIDLSKPSHTLDLCCGIDAGTLSIAHVGSAIHSELILLGDQVNCASKCQGAADKKEIVIGQDAVNSLHYKSLYSKYLTTGPSIGVVYTYNNDRYLSKRFDWETYSQDHEWAR